LKSRRTEGAGERRKHGAIEPTEEDQGLFEHLEALGVRSKDDAAIQSSAAEFILEGLWAHKRVNRSEERGFFAGRAETPEPVNRASPQAECRGASSIDQQLTGKRFAYEIHKIFTIRPGPQRTSICRSYEPPLDSSCRAASNHSTAFTSSIWNAPRAAHGPAARSDSSALQEGI